MEKLNFPLAVRPVASAHSVPGPVLACGGGARGFRHEGKAGRRQRPVCDKTHMFLHVVHSLSEGQQDGEADGA